MKKFGKKLVLSGLALAATAATLSTSTYAWYVNNPSSNVTGATAATSSAGSDGSILVSKTGAEKTFYKNIVFDAQSSALTPVTSADGKTFNTQEGTSAAASAYVTYTFYVMADAAGTFTLSCAASNETPTFRSQTAVANTAQNNGLPTEVSNGEAFTKNAADAMYMSITVTPYKVTEVEGVATETEDTVNATTKVVALNNGGFTWSADTNAPTGGFATGGDAHKYYAQYLSTTAPTENTALTTAIGTNKIGTDGLEFNVGSVKSKVDIIFWLEGGDVDCFNSCAGQNFTFDFTLDYEKATA